MSKKVLGVGLVFAGMAMMFVPGIGTALGLGAISLGAGMGSIAVATVIGMGLMIAGNVLMGPAVPKMPGSLANGARDRLFASLDVSAPRKILFGDTAGATDVRYQTYTGANQEFMEQIIAVASHKVNAIYEIWLDNELAWSSSGGVQGDFVGFLTVTPRPEATSANGIAIDTVWTATATLTGCAYIHLKFKLTGSTAETNDSPFGSGVSNRMTLRCRGASVYDPRLDSTVTGGIGTQRAGDQTTWAWDPNASRNPALQLLFYLLGWRINGKLAVGMGLPAARIDLPSFITAANACDESVAKADLTTEPRYRSDGVLSESDDRTAVVEALAATMNAVVRDAGGKLSLYVLHNDLATPVASFDENDVIGAMEWNQTPDLSAMFNITRGQRTDPSDNALYQPVDYPEVKLTSPDGIDRIDTVSYPLVQSNGQAQRLAKQRLQRNQYQGRLTLTGKPSWWQVSIGDVIQFTHPTYGWTNKLFRVAGQKISRTGATETVLVEENAAIYAWDNAEAPAIQAGTPTTYDAVNHPTQGGINTARKTSVVIDPINDVIIRADSDGTIKTGELPRDVGLKASIGTADITKLGTWSRTVTSGITCTMGAATGILNITDLTVVEVFVPITFVYGGITRTAKVHIIRQDDPPTNDGGGGGGGGTGTKASTTTLQATAGTLYNETAVSDTLTVEVGAAGKVKCDAPVGFKRTPGTASGETGCYGKWQWRAVGGTWADIGLEAQETGTATTTVNAGDPTINGAGSVSVSRTKDLLTAGATYEFRFLWRRRDVSGDIDEVYRISGTLSADGTVS